MPGQLILAAVFGACLGSFLNVAVLRFGESRSRLTGRSRCPHCSRPLTWWEMVPIFSFLALRGRCRTCRQPLTWQYPFLESLGAIVWAAAFAAAPVTAPGYAAALLTGAIATSLLLLWALDVKYFLLPDIYVLILTLGVIGRLWVAPPASPVSALAGALAGTGLLALIWAATAGRGLGFGDVKLLLPLGLLFGLPGTFTLLFLAFTAGGLTAAILLLTKQAHLKTAVPFGPYLLAAAFVLLADPALGNRIFASVLG